MIKPIEENRKHTFCKSGDVAGPARAAWLWPAWSMQIQEIQEISQPPESAKPAWAVIWPKLPRGQG